MTTLGVDSLIEDSNTAELLALLRSSTREAHFRIDHHPLLTPLLRPNLSLSHYGVVLGTLFDLYLTLQPDIAAAVSQFAGDYDTADRLAWLGSDLAYLAAHGCAVPTGLTALPPAPITSPADLIGTLYVVEGSALGGQAIARHLQASLGVDAKAGAKFFNGRGEETALYWGRFQQFAAALCPPENHAAAAVAAVAVFDKITCALDASRARHDVQTSGRTFA